MGQGKSKIAQEEKRTTHALTWMQPDRNGLPPSPRNGHTADLIESKLYIFGGGDKAELLNELFVFDVHEHMWTQPPCTGITPPPRSRHTSGVVDGRLLIWGGIGGGLDVHILDTQTMIWSAPSTHGDVPESRFGHTSSMISPQEARRPRRHPPATPARARAPAPAAAAAAPSPPPRSPPPPTHTPSPPFPWKLVSSNTPFPPFSTVTPLYVLPRTSHCRTLPTVPLP